VALCGSFTGGIATFESFTGAPGTWRPGGGTSVATPELAGLVAIADQYSRTRLGLLNPMLYRLEQAHGPGLVDVTQGSNTVSFSRNGKSVTVPGYSAGPGYDLASGVGTIDAARFVLDGQPPSSDDLSPGQELGGGQLGVEGVAGDQLSVGSHRFDPARVHNHDAVGHGHRGQPVGHD